MGEQHSDHRSKVALLAKIVSIITFPGFVAAAGFWLLREGVFVSEDLLGENVVVSHLHFSGALFGYVLVPLFFVVFFQNKSITSEGRLELAATLNAHPTR